MSYKIGYIKNTHGLKGAVIVNSITDFDRFLEGKTIYFYENNEKVHLKIKKVNETNKGLIISFYNYDHINMINNFKGKELFTDEKPELEDDEYHEEEILNKDVYNKNGILLGKVVKIMNVPQGYILRVKTKEKEVLIPFNDHFIISVLEDKIVINEIEGLI